MVHHCKYNCYCVSAQVYETFLLVLTINQINMHRNWYAAVQRRRRSASSNTGIGRLTFHAIFEQRHNYVSFNTRQSRHGQRVSSHIALMTLIPGSQVNLYINIYCFLCNLTKCESYHLSYTAQRSVLWHWQQIKVLYNNEIVRPKLTHHRRNI